MQFRELFVQLSLSMDDLPTDHRSFKLKPGLRYAQRRSAVLGIVEVLNVMKTSAFAYHVFIGKSSML